MWAVTGFAAGDRAGVMAPCPELAGLTGAALTGGLAGLSDDELVGLMRAARRVASWQAAAELAAVAELASRRAATPRLRGAPSQREAAAAELAMALTLTSAAADDLLSLALFLVRVPEVAAALVEGVIDQPKAKVFWCELTGMDVDLARGIAARLLAPAGRWTTGQLRARLRAAVLAADPEAVAARQRSGRADARVQSWAESSGNGALAGRELPAARTLLADKHMTALASALIAAGMPGTMDQVRAAVFLALLTGQHPADMLAEATTAAAESEQSPTAGTGPAAADTASSGVNDDPPWATRRTSAGPAGTGACTERTGPGKDQAGTGTGQAEAAPADADAAGRPAAPGRAAARRAAPEREDGAGWAEEGPGVTEFLGWNPDAASAWDDVPTDFDGWAESAELITWPAGLAGTINLTMPFDTWSGRGGRPGMVGGHGPADAGTCLDLADAVGAQPGTRFCLTVTTPGGVAVGHACSTGPPPGRDPPAVRAWAAKLMIEWLATDGCDHRRETASYRPGKLLEHLVKVRNPECTAPGCRRPARRADLDHVIPYDQGGRTDECNLHPGCRRHHRLKGSSGWQLMMPSPGVLEWSLPHGRTYTTSPEPYPV